MERNPTFYMEGVVQSSLHGSMLEDFEGPLALLVHLVQKNKVEIADIQIGAICDQYIAHLNQMQMMDLEVASEFVQMASHLVAIKARALLSVGEEIPELEMLIASMEELKCRTQYTQIQAIMDDFASRSTHGGGYTEKPAELFETELEYAYDHHVVDLLEAMGRIMMQQGARLLLEEEMPHFVMPTPITYSVNMKAEALIERLRKGKAILVRALFYEAESRSEMVATFIALLELCKMGSLAFAGEGEEMEVSFTGVEPEAGSFIATVAGEEEEDGD